MHTTISYANDPAPKAKAIEDIKDWLGQAKWDELYPMMSRVTNVQTFAFYCEFAGISGFPVLAWWELIHGDGSWDRAWAEIEAKAETEA